MESYADVASLRRKRFKFMGVIFEHFRVRFRDPLLLAPRTPEALAQKLPTPLHR
jgi:hypothetical protein